MHSQTRSARAALSVCLAVAAALTSDLVFAATLNWNNAGGGLASTSTNWLPIQAPTAGDDLVFNLPAIYSVTFSALAPASRTHVYKRGTVTLNMTSPHVASTGATIGDVSPDDARVTLTTGTFTVNANVALGNASGTTGVLNVDDDDADFVVGGGADLTVGVNGAATLNITGAGKVQVADQLIVGSNSTSAPTVNVSGFTITPIGASTLEVLGPGDSRVGQGGDATMLISSGALASFAANLIVANGGASASSITVEDQGLLDARLVVDGNLLIGRNVTVAAAGSGTVNVHTGGRVTVGGATFLGDPNGGTGTLHLDGGTFVGADAISVLPASTISGNGTIEADIDNNGAVLPSGGAGLTINGILFNNTNTVTGNAIHFGSGGGYVGSGSCLANISGEFSSSITATGPLTIGANTAAGYSFLGTLDVAFHDVTLVDQNGAVLGGQTLLDGGTLSCAGGIGNQNGGAIRGKGTLVGNVVNSGLIAPGTDDPEAVNITITGNLFHNPTSQVHIALNGPGATDRINVSGSATFGGTMVLTLAPGYLPRLGEQIILINAVAGRTGTFNLIHTPACSQYTLVLVYSSTAAIALVRPGLGVTAVGDIDRDGDIDLDDFDRWAPCLAGPGVLVPPPGCAPDDFAVRADLDGPACADFDVDLQDFAVMQRLLGN